MSPSVTVTTGARLHFGLLVRGKADRQAFGGLGLMIDEPRFSLTVRRAEADRIAASPGATARIQQVLSRLRTAGPKPACDVTVHEEIPPHAGLGSGTQLALALAAAIHRLDDRNCPPVAKFARLTGRGQRSAIGTVGFAAGGLILDDGRPEGDHSDAVTTRHDFPADWRFVLITPPKHQGLSGDSERDAFRQMPPMSDPQLRRLDDLLRRLPEVIHRRDFAACSAALDEFGRRVGEYFAPIQGGVFASPSMASLADKLRASGIQGVGQTSWGPTVFALCDGEAMARSVVSSLELADTESTCQYRIVAALNRGAMITVNSGN